MQSKSIAHLEELRPHILSDDTDAVWAKVDTLKGARVDIVLDNAGCAMALSHHPILSFSPPPPLLLLFLLLLHPHPLSSSWSSIWRSCIYGDCDNHSLTSLHHSIF